MKLKYFCLLSISFILLFYCVMGATATSWGVGLNSNAWGNNVSYNNTKESIDLSVGNIILTGDVDDVFAINNSNIWTQVGAEIFINETTGRVEYNGTSGYDRIYCSFPNNRTGNFELEYDIAFNLSANGERFYIFASNKSDNWYVSRYHSSGVELYGFNTNRIYAMANGTTAGYYIASANIIYHISANRTGSTTYIEVWDNGKTNLLGTYQLSGSVVNYTFFVISQRQYTNTIAGWMDNLTCEDYFITSGNLTSIVKDAENILSGSSGDVFKNVTIEGVNETDTWFHGYWNYSTDNSDFAIEDLGNFTLSANTTFGNQTRYGSIIIGHNTDNVTLTPVLHNITLYGSATGGISGRPNITSYAPLSVIWPEVQDSQLFNVTVNQSTQCRWYVNGTLKQTNATHSLTHAYINTSLKGGSCNVTASVNNTNGTDSQTWLFEVGADSIDIVILSEDQNNDSCRIRWNVTRIGSNVTHWNTSYNHTEAGGIYYKRFDNGTIIIQQTAISGDETLWFNSSTLLPVGIYYISASATTFAQSVKTGAWQYIAHVNATAQCPYQLNLTLGTNLSAITTWNATAQQWNTTWMSDWNNTVLAQVAPGEGFLAYFTQDDTITRDNCVPGLNWSFG